MEKNDDQLQYSVVQ